MKNECDRCERLQEQLDDAREVLLENGVTGFGALREGIEKVAATGIRPFAISINNKDIAQLVKGVQQSEEYLADKDNQKLSAFKMEVLRIVVEGFAEHIGIDAHRVCKDVERAVMAVLMTELNEAKKGPER